MNIATTARRIRDEYRNGLRALLLRRGLAQLDRALRARRSPSRQLCELLVRAWHNEAWSANVPLLSAIFKWLPHSNGAIAECGSGLSTLALSTAAAIDARHLHVFEHDKLWSAKVLDELPADLRTVVTVSLAPLRSYGDFDWYTLNVDSLPDTFGFVLCDGPPGTVCGGRYGLAPCLGGRLADGCVIVLDDTQRPAERSIVRRWRHELSASVIDEDETFTVLQVRLNK